jgi:hypothetical protein
MAPTTPHPVNNEQGRELAVPPEVGVTFTAAGRIVLSSS